jgi:hypothetical protein
LTKIKLRIFDEENYGGIQITSLKILFGAITRLEIKRFKEILNKNFKNTWKLMKF